jgi:hypothetical protein
MPYLSSLNYQGILPTTVVDVLRPIYQLAQLINWPRFFRQFVNPYHLINWAAN